MKLILENTETKVKRSKKSTGKQVFKPYNQDQCYLSLNDNLNNLISKNHISRIISTVVDMPRSLLR